MGKESLKKPLHFPIVGAFSGLWLWFWAGKGDVAAQGGVTARLCPSPGCSSVKYLILGRAERPGHLGLALTRAKLSCLITGRAAAAARVHKFSPWMCQVRFPFMPDAEDRKLGASNVTLSKTVHPGDTFSIPCAGSLGNLDSFLLARRE